MSGLKKPSKRVGPTLEKEGTLQFAGFVLPPSSMALTVMASGSSPGDRMVPLNGPALPAETTTTMPAFHAASTAWSSGSALVGPVGCAPSDRLMTSMPSLALLAMAQEMPWMTWPTVVAPSAPATFTATRLAAGASPMYWPLEDAPFEAIRPATKVPCPKLS